MSKFKFESEFVEANNQVIKVYCEAKDKCFTVLIDTYEDPYMIYYSAFYLVSEDEEENFRKQIFDYLKKKYPEYF